MCKKPVTDGDNNYVAKQQGNGGTTTIATATTTTATQTANGTTTAHTNGFSPVELHPTSSPTSSSSSLAVTPTHSAVKRNTKYDWFYWSAPALLGYVLRTPIGPMYLIAAMRVIITRLILSCHYILVDKDNYLNKLSQSQLQRERDDCMTATVLHLWTQVLLQFIFPQMFFPKDDGGGNATIAQQACEVLVIHILLVEPLYYAVHRWLHVPANMKSMHGFHHLSIHTLPSTSLVQNFQEHFVYIATFGPAFFLPFLYHGTMHWQVVGGYLIIFDILNAWGHTNVRLSQSTIWNHPLSPLRYLFYTPEFHLGHHAYFHANYSLFMPVWDHLCGTYREYVKTDHQRLLPKQQQDFVFIGHNAGLSHMLTCPEWNVYNAYQQYWYKLRPEVEFLLMDMICQVTRLFGSFYYCSRFLVKDDDTTNNKEYIGRIMVLLRTPRDYMCRNRYDGINKELLKLIRQQYDTCGTRYFGLGNLNKMHQLNEGGKVIVNMIQHDAYLSTKNIRIWTGDTMTAASVYHQIADIPKLDRLFYIGAGGKVGNAVCMKLVQTNPNMKIRIFSKNPTLDHANITYTNDLSELLDYKVVLVGKSLNPKQYQRAFGTITRSNKDVQTRYILDYTVPFIPMEAARQYPSARIQHIQVGLLQTFPNNPFLKGHYDVCMSHDENHIYPCHFGCLLNTVEQRETNEVGEIDLNEMEPQWQKALARGFHNRDIKYM
jgi:sterol desaturase/sphingolipid hydroxylase (fatty acid hydroxylase superfamily)